MLYPRIAELPFEVGAYQAIAIEVESEEYFTKAVGALGGWATKIAREFDG